MDTFSSRMVVVAGVFSPSLSLANVPSLAGSMSGHWDSVLLVALGALIVWHEIRSSVRKSLAARKSNARKALGGWQKPARPQSNWVPVLAKFHQSSRR